MALEWALTAKRCWGVRGRTETSVVAQVAPQRRFTDDIDALLDLELAERINDAVPLRKDIKKVYGVQDSGIAKELLYAIQRRFTPNTTKPESKASSQYPPQYNPAVYLHDGLTPTAAVCQTDGPGDAGKSSFEIEKCIAVVEGRSCFDRDHPTKQGSVLFIATTLVAMTSTQPSTVWGIPTIPQSSRAS